MEIAPNFVAIDSWTVHASETGMWGPDTDGAGALTSKLRATAAVHWFYQTPIASGVVYRIKLVIDSVSSGTVTVLTTGSGCYKVRGRNIL